MTTPISALSLRSRSLATAVRLACCVLPLVIAAATVVQAGPVREKHVVAELVSSHRTIAAGEPFTLGLKFTIDETWHTYWSNPGESGKATTLALSLPEGFVASEMRFPAPKRFITDYGFGIREAGFGYEGTVIHLITVTPPETLPIGESVTLSGETDFLMCDPVSCVPGRAALSIELAVGAAAQRSPEAPLIGFHEGQVPKPVDWEAELLLEGGELVFLLAPPEGAIAENAALSLYPKESFLFDQLAESEFSTTGDGRLRVATKKHDELEALPASFAAVLVAETSTGSSAFAISMGDPAPEGGTPVTAVQGAGAAEAGETIEIAGAGSDSGLPFGGGLLGVLLGAFVGGIILNIMPCVFPVISLKVMSFVGQAGEDRKKVFAHALVFALGVLVFFWALTTAMLVLRALGSEDVGWGVQLRQPGFVLGLVFVMVAVAMSLFGVFEIGASMTAVGGDLAHRAGYAGSFWSGALAVLLATPCTAPFMAPAIGFAMVQSGPVMFLIFTSLGLGLAAPYFVFAAFPRLLDFIPRPGAWMETFKQLMGFPMLAVAVWLIGVLSRQLDVAGLQWALSAVLLLGLAGWILGRFTGFERQAAVRLRARIAAVMVFVLSLAVAVQATGKRAPATVTDFEAIIAQHQAEGRHVFVDFTAEWCVTCKVNERVTLKTDAVQNAFAEHGIEFLIADWTNEDPGITRLLQRFGRSGVPFYVLYPSDPSAPPITLPDGLITVGHIMGAIEKLPQQSP